MCPKTIFLESVCCCNNEKRLQCSIPCRPFKKHSVFFCQVVVTFSLLLTSVTVVCIKSFCLLWHTDKLTNFNNLQKGPRHDTQPWVWTGSKFIEPGYILSLVLFSVLKWNQGLRLAEQKIWFGCNLLSHMQPLLSVYLSSAICIGDHGYQGSNMTGQCYSDNRQKYRNIFSVKILVPMHICRYLFTEITFTQSYCRGLC